MKGFIRTFLSTPALSILLALGGMIYYQNTHAQISGCGTNVPFYNVDLSGSPAGSWISPTHARNGNCCGTTSPDRCTSFEILLDTNSVGLVFEIVSGAIPSGSMFYQIDCGPQVPVGNVICLSGPGPHHLTFCKPGNNTNQYRIRSVAAPVVQADDTTRLGCSLPLIMWGVNASSVTWNTIFPGSVGQYNSVLQCTSGCTNNIITPTDVTISYYDIQVCGMPVATQCGFTALVCDTVRVYVAPELTGNISPTPATFCQLGAGSGVNIVVSAIGGGIGTTYSWLNSSGVVVSTTSSYFASQPGNYTVQLNDEYSSPYCPSALLTIPVSEVIPPSANAGLDEILCASEPLVILSATTMNSSGYEWTGGDNGYLPSSLSQVASYEPSSAEIAAGFSTHYFTAYPLDAVCAAAIDTVVISYLDSIQVVLSDTTLACAGDSIILIPAVSGGSGIYSYQWSNGTTTNNATIAAGNYCLEVTDDFSCVQTTCVVIAEPTTLLASTSSTDVTTNGGSDGTATVAVSGGTPGYTYLWSTGGTTATITGLSQGLYTCLVTDANGCSINALVAVIEPVCLGFNTSITFPEIGCFGDSTSATALVQFGTAPFTYVWDDGLSQITPTASGLPAGTYNVVVQDSNDCYATAQVQITQPQELMTSITELHVSTVGGNDGSVTVNTIGGTTPYTFTWSTGDTTQTISGLSAGVYWVEVTDSNGCSVIDSALIEDPDCSDMMLALQGFDLSCYENNSGSVVAQVAGGQPGYSFFWNGTTGADTLSNVAAGLYTLIVFDQRLCSIADSISLSEPVALSISGSTANVSCYDSLNGSIDVTVSGGTFPYSYSWNNGAQSEDLLGQHAGTYILSVVDFNGCATQFAAVIDQQDSIALSYDIQANECYGIPTGYINLSVSGGVAPYNYAWSNGSSTEDLIDVLGGLYFVEVTDANGCNLSSIEPVFVGQVDSMLVSLSASLYTNGHNVSANGAQDGWIQSSVSGGVPPYQYNWSNGATDSSLVAGAGNYSLVVTDNNGCTQHAAIELTGPAALQFPSVITDNNDNRNDQFIILGLEQYPVNEITIYNRWGNLVYQETNYQNTWTGNNADNEPLPEGNYFYLFSAPELETINGFVEIKR